MSQGHSELGGLCREWGLLGQVGPRTQGEMCDFPPQAQRSLSSGQAPDPATPAPTWKPGPTHTCLTSPLPTHMLGSTCLSPILHSGYGISGRACSTALISLEGGLGS